MDVCIRTSYYTDLCSQMLHTYIYNIIMYNKIFHGFMSNIIKHKNVSEHCIAQKYAYIWEHNYV